jgi:hypothetical protein
MTEPISVTALSVSALRGLAQMGIMSADGGDGHRWFRSSVRNYGDLKFGAFGALGGFCQNDASEEPNATAEPWEAFSH